jgi:hypothetical protein
VGGGEYFPLWRSYTMSAGRKEVSAIGAYEQFVTNRLTQAPGIAKIDSHLTMKAIN